MGHPLAATLRFILDHPLNRGRAAHALSRYVGWQVASRIRSPREVPFVDDTRLLVDHGMSGATGNIYCGLTDFAEMGFVLHALRAGDLFFDVGANVGSYTVLAAGAARAQCLSFEPVPTTFVRLEQNIALNGLEGLVRPLPYALGARDAETRFTSHMGPANHALGTNESTDGSVTVSVRTVDSFWPPVKPPLVVMKVDVEGYETEVIRGAGGALRNPSLKAMILELWNGSAGRYEAADDWAVHHQMLDHGFRLYRYNPLTRVLEQDDERTGGNNLYVRDAGTVQERLISAPRHRVHGVEL